MVRLYKWQTIVSCIASCFVFFLFEDLRIYKFVRLSIDKERTFAQPSLSLIRNTILLAQLLDFHPLII